MGGTGYAAAPAPRDPPVGAGDFPSGGNGMAAIAGREIEIAVATLADDGAKGTAIEAVAVDLGTDMAERLEDRRMADGQPLARLRTK